MSFNDKVLLLPDARKLSIGQAEIDIDDAMALRAGEVVVVFVPVAYAVVMGAIRELDAGEQSPVHQLFNRAIDRGAAYARLVLA